MSESFEVSVEQKYWDSYLLCGIKCQSYGNPGISWRQDVSHMETLGFPSSQWRREKERE